MPTSPSKSRRRGKPSPYALGVRRHAGLIESVARRVHANLPPSVQLDDLLQEGARGLIQAIRSFDPTAGLAFTQHARIIVERRILDGLKRSARQSIDLLDDALPAAGDDAPACVASVLADAARADPVAALMTAEIRAAIGNRVTPRERRALYRFFVDELTQREAAAEVGMSQDGFNKLIARARRRLQASPKLRELAGLSPSPGTPGEGWGEGLPSKTNHARRAQGRARPGRQGRRRTDAERGGAGGQTAAPPAQDGPLPTADCLLPTSYLLQPGPPCPRKEAS